MKRLLLLAPILFLAACAQPAAEPAKPAVDIAKESAAIQKQSDDWKVAAKARDAAKTASFWSNDATLVEPGSPSPIVGHDALQKFVEEAFKDKNFSIDWTTTKIEVAASGDLAYETANETFTSTQGKKVMTSKVVGLVIWKKQADGSWKAVYDIGAPQAEAPMKK